MSIETEATKATDPLYAKACEFVRNTGKTSISAVQRELQIGYNRAARHLEAMEADGIISPMDRYGVRKLLVPNVELRGERSESLSNGGLAVEDEK